MKYLFLVFILISCSATPKGEYYIGRTKELLILDKGVPTTITDTSNGQIITYWTWNRFRKKTDVVKIHKYYLDKQEKIYKYLTYVNQFSK